MTLNQFHEEAIPMLCENYSKPVIPVLEHKPFPENHM